MDGGKSCDVFVEPGGIFEISVLEIEPTETQTVSTPFLYPRRIMQREKKQTILFSLFFGQKSGYMQGGKNYEQGKECLS